MSTVLLTGASGFIALHVLDVLLSKGYKVIGTVRTQSQADNITVKFKKLYPQANLSFAIVPDIGVKDAFDQVLKSNSDITDVIHTASPFSFGLDKPLEEAYLIPATEGTKNILNAVKEYAPNVKHFVQTSSFAAIMNMDKFGDSSFIHTEKTWNPIEWKDVDSEFLGYIASKKLAEKLARDFVEDEKPSFSITTVNPPYVLGPQMFDDVLVNPTLNTSAELVHQLLKTPKDETKEVVTFNPFTCIDVRDVAFLHVLPLEKELPGKRFLPVSSAMSGQFFLNLIHKEFPELDGVVGKGDPEVGTLEKAQEKAGIFYDNSESLRLSGLKSWIPIEKTIKDSVKQILDYQKKTQQ